MINLLDKLHEWEMRILYSEHYKKLGYKCMMAIRTAPTEQEESYRSRIVHTEEVRKIALKIWDMLDTQKRKLLIDDFKQGGFNILKKQEDSVIRQLISLIARAHDIGHPPFGHAGEKALQRILSNDFEDYLGLSYWIEKRKIDLKIVREYNKGKAYDLDKLSNIRKKAVKRENKRVFSHTSHSVKILSRLLKKDDKSSPIDNVEETIRNSVLDAIANHGWKPWGDSDKPKMLIGQLVAISDQIATIISDLEELETIKYSDYSWKFNYFAYNPECKINSYYDRIDADGSLIEKIKELECTKDEHAVQEFICGEFSDEMGKESSSYNRFDYLTKLVSNSIKINIGGKAIEINNLNKVALAVLEDDIRKHINHKIPWFIARDSMAIAILSALFNHIWARMPMPGTHTLRNNTTKYVNDFEEYVKLNYRPNSSNNYLKFIKHKAMGTWDTNILCYHLANIDRRISEDKCQEWQQDWSVVRNRLVDRMGNRNNKNEWTQYFNDHSHSISIYLIALIDFISYQTDEYCIRAFEDIHKEFLNADLSLAKKESGTC